MQKGVIISAVLGGVYAPVLLAQTVNPHHQLVQESRYQRDEIRLNRQQQWLNQRQYQSADNIEISNHLSAACLP